MPNSNFIVFWYPTIFHKRRVRLDSFKSEFREISDGAIDELCLKVDEVGASNTSGFKDLQFTLRFGDEGAQEKSFKFKHVSECKNGFVVYSYDRQSISAEIQKTPLINAGRDVDAIIDDLFISCYHLAKEICHKHEVQSDSDGRLKAYFKTDSTYLAVAPNISLANNEVINYYIDQFEAQFDNYAHTVSDEYERFLMAYNKYQEISVSTPSNDYNVAVNQLAHLFMLRKRWDKSDDDIEEAKRKKNSRKSATTSGQSQTVDNLIEEMKKQLEDEKKYFEKATGQKELDYFINETKKQFPKENGIEGLQRKIILFNSEVANMISIILKDIQKTAGNALTEYNYCRTLLESKYAIDYNRQILFDPHEVYHLSHDDGDGSRLFEQDSHRKKHFNILNSIQYIEEVREKCAVWRTALTHFLVDQVTRLAIELGDLTTSNGALLKKVGDLASSNGALLKEVGDLETTNTDLLKEAKRSNKIAFGMSLFFGVISIISLIFSICGNSDNGNSVHKNLYEVVAPEGAELNHVSLDSPIGDTVTLRTAVDVTPARDTIAVSKKYQ